MAEHRILIITHHFPPSTVAATFRPLRLAKYLPRLGHKVWVLTTTSGLYSGAGRSDPRLLEDVPPEVRVTRIPSTNPVLWYQSRTSSPRSGSAVASHAPGIDHVRRARPTLRSTIAELAVFPDIDTAWAVTSLLPALHAVLRNRIDVIYTNGPPFGSHLLGLALKRLTGRTWLAQYANPWTANPSIFWKSGYLRRKCEQLDRTIARRADAVLVLDDVLAGCIEDLGRRDGVYIYPNGYDPEHFSAAKPPAGKFTITYAGSLYNVHDPRIIYDALSLVEARNPAARADMRVVFAGPPESDPMRHGAPNDLVFTGPLRHSEVVRRLQDSHVLLDFLTAPAAAKFTVSCKLYEYMAARRQILAVTPEGPMAREVRRLNLGTVAPCDDPAAVAEAIIDLYDQHRLGRLHAPDNPAIEDYSAPKLADDFCNIVAEVQENGVRASCTAGRAR